MLSDLRPFYNLYSEAIHEWRNKRINLQLDVPDCQTKKLGILRALAIRFIHILFARLNAVAKTGSIYPFFQNQWDPIITEIFSEKGLVGCFSLIRQSEQVFEIEVIGILNTESRESTMHEIIKIIQKYVKRLGGSRVIVSTGSNKIAELLKNYDFKLAFVDDVLYYDL
jgi:hypothetical protein